MEPKKITEGQWVRDINGDMIIVPVTTGMMFPVRCLRCFSTYDSAAVTVTQRYADCSVWNAPCCGAQVDDRPRGWGGGIEKLY